MHTPQSSKHAIRRRGLLMGIGFVATFMLGDWVLSQVRLPRVYGSKNEARWKWELFEASPDAPDVVFIGCSYAWCGVSPKTLDAEVARLTGRSITSLNLAATASSLLTQSLLARHIVEADRLPELVYFGVNPSTATSARRNHWLAGGLRALGDARDVPAAARESQLLFWVALRTALFQSCYQWDDSHLIARYTAIGAPLMPPSRIQRDNRGWGKHVGGSARPVSTTKQWKSVEEKSAWDAGGFDTRNINGRSLRNMVDRLRSAGVAVRLLEMPTATTVAPERNPERNRAYQAFLTEFTAEARVMVVRPPPGLVCNEDFFDSEHLNATGAEKFSRWLATDVAGAMAARNRGASTETLAARDTPG